MRTMRAGLRVTVATISGRLMPSAINSVMAMVRLNGAVPAKGYSAGDP
jgi:hypothetical protein